jgi:hypothetical protein
MVALFFCTLAAVCNRCQPVFRLFADEADGSWQIMMRFLLAVLGSPFSWQQGCVAGLFIDMKNHIFV